MKVLIIDDNIAFATTIANVIHKMGVEAECVYSPNDSLNYLEKYYSDVMLIFLDVEFGLGELMTGLDLLDIFRKEYISIPVVMLSGQGTIETAVKATKLGAINFIEKNNITIDKVKDVIEVAKKNNSGYGSDAEIRKFLEANGIIGKSQAIIKVGENIIRYGRTDLSVLIIGATGTGKKLVASAIHNISRRTKSSLVTVDTPNITEENFHITLFGANRNITNTNTTIKGFFQQADKGSLFFDDITFLPIKLQTNLLTPIEEKSIHKLGSIENEIVDIRFISSSSENILEKIKSGLFNEQLYHRLRECEITLPPLSERIEDIPEIVNYHTKKHNQEFNETKYFSSSATEFLMEQNWVGNVRELYSVIKACLQTNNFSKTNAIEVSHILREVNKNTKNLSLKELNTAIVSVDSTLGEDVAQVNKIKIEKTLQRTFGNVSKAAAMLGVSRETLHNKIRKFEINNQQYRRRDK